MDVKKEQNRAARAQARTGGRMSGRNTVQVLTVALLLTVLSALFARAHVIFGSYPLALALLAVVRKSPLPVLIGASVSALTGFYDGWLHVLFYTLLFSIRFLCSVVCAHKASRAGVHDASLFDEPPQLQITAVLLTGATMGGLRLLQEGLLTHTMLYALSAVLVPTVCAVFFMLLFSAELRFSDLTGTRRYAHGELSYGGLSPLAVEAGLIAFASAVCYAVSAYELFGLSLGMVASTVCTLCAARRFGALRGCVMGMMTGMSVTPTYALAFGILGLLSGALFAHGTGYALIASVCGAGAGLAYFGGLSGMLGVFPEVCMTALLTWPIYSHMHRPSDALAAAEEDRAVSHAAESASMRREREAHDRIGVLGEALLSVSDAIRREGQNEEQLDLSECFSFCKRICMHHCHECKEKTHCWTGESSLGLASVLRMAETLSHSGTLRIGEESYMHAACIHEEEIVTAVRAEAASRASANRSAAHSAQIATEYRMLARILGDEARVGEEERRMDTEASGKIAAALASVHAALSDATVQVFGKKIPRVTVASRASRILADCADGVRELLSNVLSCAFSEGVYEETGQIATLCFEAVPRYGIEVASAVRPSRMGDVSGDTVTYFDGECKSYALLSDGMGKGGRAARASRLACDFFEHMLGAGCDEERCAEMLHHILRGRADECAASVDLFCYDLLRGDAFFLKCGAAASYVKRGKTVFRVRGKTPPIGILRDYGGEIIRFDAEVGDTVILLSDGVAAEGDETQKEETAYLLRAISEELQTDDLQLAAERILAQAAERSTGGDDQSVMLVRLYACDGSRDAQKKSA